MTKSEIAALPNLGQKSEELLNRVGIYTESDLREHGSVAAFRMLEEAECRPSLNMLWAIEGALSDTPWEYLPLEVKERLKEELERQRGRP